MATDVFSQVKFLVQDKGMNLEEAIREIESKLRGQLPEHLVNLIKEEINAR